nr:hypothetical protein [uncultured Roseateles sp.]
MTSTATTCPTLGPSAPALSAGWLGGLLKPWALLRARRRAKVDMLALAELSEHTLDDINAPCWMYLEAKAQREAEHQRLDALRMGGNVSW